MKTIPKTLPLLLLACLTAWPLTLQPVLPAWIFMWMLAIALFYGSKVMIIADGWDRLPTGARGRALGFLFLWPGMDLKPFAQTARSTDTVRPELKEWWMTLAKTVLGVVLIWGIVPALDESHWVIRAVTGMLGVIFLLHFGLFHLLALGWQMNRIPVRPLMLNPARSTSLAEFWGRRWNSGFHDLVHQQIFRPMAKKAGAQTAMLGVFLASGFIHELVITVPARGGYGLPTFYFLFQGLGVILERSVAGRKLGLAHGARGWWFMLLCTAGPVACLFPPPFLKNVILPMLESLT